MALPPLYALRAFEAAARLGSFSKAADDLNVTAGAVSRHIRTMESWCGCELFRRHGPRVQITDAGRVLADQLTEGFERIEQACHSFRGGNRALRLKAPSTLTMRWLLDVLNGFREVYSTPVVEASSVWMDTDTVDFSKEPYDCAILLGDGHFGTGTESRLLFEEWLIPVCSPKIIDRVINSIHSCDIIHPSPDRRDWRRWLKRTSMFPDFNIHQGKVFDTLEQGNMAAISGYGVSVGDLYLSMDAINTGLLMLPFDQAVATGDGYYLVWPTGSPGKKNIDLLYQWLLKNSPCSIPQEIECLR
ncbi:LysR family transcriptional regulator [Kushneria sp. TE3]|uniref:LysR family transcriptional regulator n=1 Tax=Kushneria sp. TE3 TaxID=3449832 RepID=UPI003F686376